jgi:hypothetical protein
VITSDPKNAKILPEGMTYNVSMHPNGDTDTQSSVRLEFYVSGFYTLFILEIVVKSPRAYQEHFAPPRGISGHSYSG